MRLLHTAIKMTIVGVLASLLASLLSVEYSITTGIIAILCINLTKRDSLTMSGKRLVGVLFGLILSTLLFLAFGYNFIVFSIFIFIYAYSSWVLKMPEGIVPGLVLVSHLLNEGTFSFPVLLNAVYIMLIAVGISTVFNILYPTISEKELNRHVESIDQLIRDHLYMLSLLIKDPGYKEEYYRHFQMLDRKISNLIDQVEIVDKDVLFMNDHSYLSYFHMRKEQASYIRHMYQQALKIQSIHPFAKDVSTFILELSYDIRLYNRAVTQLRKLDVMQKGYKNSELPKSRDEFETRSSLFQILNEIESLLMVKVSFHHQYPNFSDQVSKL